ncbi:hypothetical protein D770_05310 [Flammeovirgaceae bacterium 311]|nr:hypothetical protein D770_05310 [Flammeovirgaceae bacterium 311]
MNYRSIRIPFLLITFFICSCRTERDDEEMEVLNDSFLEMIGTDYYLMPFPVPPFKPFHPDSLDEPINMMGDDSISFANYIAEYNAQQLEEYENFDWDKYRKDSLAYEEFIRNRPVDTARLVVILHDSLIAHPKTNLLKRILTESGFRDNFYVDLSWRDLALKLVDSIHVARALPIHEITASGKYILAYENEYQPSKRDRIVGFVRFSRVAFSKDGDKACFVFSFVCGGECGFGSMVFGERLNNKWKIVGQRELWIS